MPYTRLLSRSRIHNLALLAAFLSAFRMTPLSITVGVALFALGFILQIWSKSVLRRDRILATRGPYALCRHPFYLANGLLDWGLIVMAGHVLVILAYPCLFLLAYLPAVRHEEQVLLELFPQEQQAYRSHTARFLPNSLRVFSDWRSSLSWQVLLNESQLSRSTRHAAFPLVVLLAGRVWADATTWRDPFTKGLSASIAGLLFLGILFYGQLEHGARRPLLRNLAEWIARHANLLLIAGIPVAVMHMPSATPLLIALCIGDYVVRETGGTPVHNGAYLVSTEGNTMY